MVAVGLSLVVVLAIALGGGLLLYVLVREETRNRPTMDRTSGERSARRDTDEDP